MRNNATSQEDKLYYQFLRKFKVRIHRQGLVISLTLQPKAKLVIELDGVSTIRKEDEQDDAGLDFVNRLYRS